MKLLEGAGKYSTSTVVLVVANLIPLIGVFAWGWSAFNVVALYWMENLIIGGITILKMLTCNPDEDGINQMVAGLKKKAALALGERGRSKAISSGGMDDQRERQIEEQMKHFKELSGKAGFINHGAKLFLIPFFVVHYGMFCAVHGVFVMVLLGGDQSLKAGGGMSGGPIEGGRILVEKVLGGGGFWFVLALLASHLFSFFVNYIGKGEYRKTVVPQLMFTPYPRIVVLHLAILFGAFLVMALGSSLFLVMILVVGKILIDLGLHLRSHRKLEEAAVAKAAEQFENQTT
jgi:hypothetical protein